ncbi:MAG: response regulator transcription factor [Candidatus Marinimicrobia bacterium]|nr:response regulator transcription factor [Candidatus Neomarinimicrobiota bacterium]
MIRVFVADDHNIVREGLIMVLSANEEINIVGWADNGASAVKQICSLKPDVALLDISMPEMNGILVARAITKDCPSVRTIILSMYSSREYIHQSLLAGVSGYLLKHSAASQLIEAVQYVHRGGQFFSDAIRDIVIELQAQPDYVRPNPVPELTSREIEILKLIAKRLTSKEISDRLFISTRTVEKHRENMMNKLDLHDVAGLVQYALANDIEN